MLLPSTKLKDIISSALGRIPLDLIIKGTDVLNVFTGEIIENQWIGIYKDTIAYVGKPDTRFYSRETLEARRNTIAIPGLVDTHLHIESTMMVPSRFAEAVLPHGTTTVFADPHEIVNVFGKRGLRMMLNNSKNLAMKIFYLAPPCVPESSAVTSGARIDSRDIEEMLEWDRVEGLAEVMDYPALLKNDPRIRRIVEAARNKGVIIDGHSPLLKGAELSAYVASGAEADHENFYPDDSVVEKLRKGMYLKLRGPDVLEPKKFVEMIQRLPKPWKVLFVTDDVMPDRLARFGHLDNVCRSFIESGLDPVEAVRSVTLRAAEHTRNPAIGAIGPGKFADIVLLDDLKEFAPRLVVSGGNVVAKDGKLTVSPKKIRPRNFPTSSTNSVHVKRLREEDFTAISPKMNGAVEINCIDFPNASVPSRSEFSSLVLTALGVLRSELVDGIPKAKDMATVFVFGRHRKDSGRRAFAFVHNLIREGAVATTVSHDSHNLTVVGTNPKDMLIAASAVVQSKGGVAVAKRGALLAQIKLPVAGLMSELPISRIASDMKKVREAFRAVGMIDHPYMPIPFLLSLSVIPHARITLGGLFDVDEQKIVPAFRRAS